MSFEQVVLQAANSGTPDLNTLVTVLGIALPVLGGIYALARKLDRIEDNTEPIKDIEKVIIRLDERTKNLPIPPPSTSILELPQLGNVKVSAEPSIDMTTYNILFSKPILSQGIYEKITLAPDSELPKKEKELFGEVVKALILSSSQIILYIPSGDAKKCTSFIGFYLKWMDSVYYPKFSPVKEEFERISVD